jgi:hypothetical protein
LGFGCDVSIDATDIGFDSSVFANVLGDDRTELIAGIDLCEFIELANTNLESSNAHLKPLNKTKMANTIERNKATGWLRLDFTP